MNDGTILRIWNGFTPEQQNMSFQQFRKEMKELTDPGKIMSDVGDIQLRRAAERSNRIRIERGMKGK